MTDKPWSKEPTPIVDSINESGDWCYDAMKMYNAMEARARDLEQQLRYSHKRIAGLLDVIRYLQRDLFDKEGKNFSLERQEIAESDAYLKATEEGEQ